MLNHSRGLKLAAKKNVFDRAIPLVKTAAQGTLAGIQEIGVPIMKNMLRNLSPYPAVFSERLVDGITSAMIVPENVSFGNTPGNPNRKFVGSNAREEDILEPETKELTLKIGTRYKVAKYVDKGTGPHRTSMDTQEFVAKVTEWCQKKGFDADETESIIKKIRDEGTMRRPFLEPTRQLIHPLVDGEVSKSVSKVFKNMPKVRTIISDKGIKVEESMS